MACSSRFSLRPGSLALLSALALPAQFFLADTAAATVLTFGNNTPITISSANPVSGNPYPSTIAVSGFTGLTTDVVVTLVVSHTFPDDLDILLVSPTGQKTLLMSEAGGNGDLVNVVLTFSDAAAGFLPDSAQIVAGTYKPTNYLTGDTFPPPAPAGPYAANPLSVFDGFDPNGNWSLYVMDDASFDGGSISSWSLRIEDAPVQPSTPTPTVPEPSSLLLIAAGALGASARRLRKA